MKTICDSFVINDAENFPSFITPAMHRLGMIPDKKKTRTIKQRIKHPVLEHIGRFARKKKVKEINQIPWKGENQLVLPLSDGPTRHSLDSF